MFAPQAKAGRVDKEVWGVSTAQGLSQALEVNLICPEHRSVQTQGWV